MVSVTGYERPSTIEDALACLRRPYAVPVGGGTALAAAPGTGPVLVVDLQALGLDRIERRGPERMLVGAGVTLQALADDASVPPAVRDAARRELPSTLRAAATVGGCAAAARGESELFATLLVHDALVRTATGGAFPLSAGPRLQAGDVITEIEIATDGVAASARTGRTRADRPIVAAVARRSADGSWRLAVTGVASSPQLVDDVGGLDPPSDFRGSSDYRRALCATLAERARDEVEARWTSG